MAQRPRSSSSRKAGEDQQTEPSDIRPSLARMCQNLIFLTLLQPVIGHKLELLT